MKKAVVTLCFGKEFENIASYTHPILKNYAQKVNADFIVINNKKLSKKFIHYEKFQIYDLLLDYNRIIYLDTDLIIRPDCPDLFEIVPEHKIGVFNEGAYMDFLEVVRDSCIKFKISIKKWDRQSYNTGVMVLSRIHRDIFKKPNIEYDSYNTGGGHVVYHYEQPYLNLKIITGDYEVHDIGYRFNRMYVMDKLTGENRLSSYIVHYAGIAREVQLNLIREDIKAWSESKDYKYPRNIHIRVGGGLGDQICAEPVVRYISEKIYPGDNIRVDTDFPEIFEHLKNIKLIKAGEPVQDPTVYYDMETLPAPDKPLWHFLAHTLCHSVDFSSIATLRRTLPDKDKEIRQVVEEKDLQSLSVILNGRKPQVLVHPGKGWPSKTFPVDYWQDIINSLIEKGIVVAIIGKYISDKQGLVEVSCPEGCIDLRNLLSYKELVALISQTEVLISNDSAPVHIAGAFDNWIILLPSCKHPDHVLPYRKGLKTYKAMALYKKLTCDAIDSSPTQVEGQTVDYVIGDIRDYLEDVPVIVQRVMDCLNH